MKEWIQEQIVGPIREVAKRLPLERSPKWNSVRKAHLVDYPVCAVCRTRKGLNVHHIIPFHKRPDLELEESNLITLCRKHHFTFGHLCWWRSWNEDVRKDAGNWRYKLLHRPS